MFFFKNDSKKIIDTNITNNNNNNNNKRLFSILNFPGANDLYGKYYGRYPGQAAYKAFNKMSNLINLSNANKNKFLIFSLIDRKTHKVYTYQGTKIKLHKPIVFRTKDNKVINIKYKSIVTKYNKKNL